jgi:hypothetical protein
MSQSTQSLMNTKGWHYDVTDRQIKHAQKVLETLNMTSHIIYYSEQPDPLVFGKRLFQLYVSQENHHNLPPSEWLNTEQVDIASFDSYGNLVIYASFLCTGGRQSTASLPLGEMNC